MKWYQLGRQQSCEEAFKGPVACDLIDNPAAVERLMRNYDLWYFKYSTSSNKKDFKLKECASYFGVYDIDIKHDVRTAMIKEATIAGSSSSLLQLLEPELAVIKEALKNVPFNVYASGSKGLHVYTMDPRMFAKLPQGMAFKPAFVEHFLVTHLPMQMVSLLDVSIYNMGSGIRPFTRSHPATCVMPFCLIRSFSDFDFFEFLVTQLPLVSLSETVLPTLHPAPRLAVSLPSVAVTPISHQTNLNLLEFVKENSGLADVSIKSRRKGTVYLSGHWCPIKKGFHDERSDCTFWYRSDNDVWVCQCFATGCLKAKFFLRRIASPVTMPTDSRIKPENISSIEIQGKYLPEDEIISRWRSQPRSVLCSGLGSGKTTMFVSYLKKLDQEAIEQKKPRSPVIIIGTRRSQCKCWFNKFAGLGFTDYDVVTGSLSEFDRVILCLNSVNRLADRGKLVIRPGTILMIDEVVAFCRWLGGSLLGKSNMASQPYIFELVKILFERCHQVICMDGLPDNIVSYYLDLIGQLHRFKWVVNTTVSDDKLWKIYHHTRVFHGDLMRAVQSGKKVVLVCNLKSHIHTFVEYFTKDVGIKPEEILAISGSMPESLRNAAGDPNGCWGNYRIVLYNHSLGPGASFDFPNVFEVYGVCAADQGFDPILAIQLFNRTRHPIGNRVHLLMLHRDATELNLAVRGEDLLRKMCETVSDYTRFASPVVEEFLDYNCGGIEEEEEVPPLDENLNRLMGVGSGPRPVVATPHILRTNTVYDDESNQLVQEVAPFRQTFILRFEPNPLLKLMAEIQASAHNATLSSELFLEQLTDLITRSGGLIKVIGTPPCTKAEKTFHYRYFKKMTSSPEFKPVHAITEHYLFSALPQLSTEQNNMIKEQLQLDNNNMARFRQLYKVLIREGGEEQEPASKYVALDATRNNLVPALVDPVIYGVGEVTVNQQAIARATLNHTETIGELLPLVRELMKICNMTVSEGVYQGSLDTKDIHDCSRVKDLIYQLFKLRKRKEGNIRLKTIRPSMQKHFLLKDRLIDIFKWLGFELKQTASRRGSIPKKRTKTYTLEADTAAFQTKLASLGIAKCGQKRTRDEAYLSLFIDE